MKITDYQIFVVANSPPHHGGIYWIFIKLITDSGFVRVRRGILGSISPAHN